MDIIIYGVNMINQILLSDDVVVFGHRGFSEEAPENTMASFMLCRERAVPGVELDVHLAGSGEVVVAHDFSLKRTAGVDRVIEEMDLNEIKSFDVGSFKSPRFSDQRIPLLEEIFDKFGNVFIYDIELKSRSKTRNHELARKTWDIICRYGLQSNVLVSSFNPFSIRAFNKVCRRSVPSADIFAISPHVPRILQHGFGRHVSRSSYLKPEFSQIDQSSMLRLKERYGYPIVAWTVNDRETAMRMIALGVDGLIGNNPGLLMDCVRESRRTGK